MRISQSIVDSPIEARLRMINPIQNKEVFLPLNKVYHHLLYPIRIFKNVCGCKLRTHTYRTMTHSNNR